MNGLRVGTMPYDTTRTLLDGRVTFDGISATITTADIASDIFRPPHRDPRGASAHRTLAERDTRGRRHRRAHLVQRSAVRTRRIPPGRPLVPDYETVERDYYRRTGIFLTMHAVVLPRSLVTERPDLARTVYNGYLAAKNAGMSRYHVYRRTVATEMDRAGLSVRAAADQLGHAQVSMTQDRYFGRQVVETGAAGVMEAVASEKQG